MTQENMQRLLDGCKVSMRLLQCHEGKPSGTPKIPSLSNLDVSTTMITSCKLFEIGPER